MDIHQSRKVEMDAKEDKFTTVFQQADLLVAKNHYAHEQINERIGNLREQKNILEEEWDIHWEDLQLSTYFPFYIISLFFLISYITLINRYFVLMMAIVVFIPILPAEFKNDVHFPSSPLDVLE